MSKTAPHFEIESLGLVTVTNRKGETIEIESELVLHMADELRSLVNPARPPTTEYVGANHQKPVATPRPEWRPPEPDFNAKQPALYFPPDDGPASNLVVRFFRWMGRDTDSAGPV